MYALGMIALLGLAVLVVARVADRYVSTVAEVRAFTFAVLGVAAAWLIHLNLFSLWSIPVRNDWLAVTLTGFALAGAAGFWQALLGFFSGLSRKFNDQARTLERGEHLRRAA